MPHLEPTPPGFRIVRSGELDSNTPQTPGMTRAEAISYARVGAQKLWAGTVVVHPNAKTGPHQATLCLCRRLRLTRNSTPGPISR
jgi:uncharacterized RmlC-like cupin family protein